MTGKKIVVDRKFVLPKNFWPSIFDERKNIKNSNLKNTLSTKYCTLQLLKLFSDDPHQFCVILEESEYYQMKRTMVIFLVD